MSVLLIARLASCIAERFVKRLQRATGPNTRSKNENDDFGENTRFAVYMAIGEVTWHQRDIDITDRLKSEYIGRQ